MTEEEYYALEITRTYKLFGSSNESFVTYDDAITREFGSLDEVKEFLAGEYAKPCKKTKIYTDTENKEAIHVGWIYHYRDRDEGCFRQDWVCVRHVVSQSVPIII